MKKLIALTIASLSLSVPSTAYALDTALFSIIFKIYQEATSPKYIHESTQPDAKPAESFAKSKAAQIAPESSNSPIAVEKSAEATSIASEAQNSNLSPSEAFEKAQAQHAEAVKQAREHKLALKNAPKAVDTESELYLAEFNARKLTNKQFASLYYNRSFGTAYLRNNVTLDNASDKEKITIEKALQFKEKQQAHLKNYHKAFQVHVKNVVKDLGLSFVELRELAIKGDVNAQEDFNLNPAGDAIQIKNMWAGVTNYEISHPNLNTNCLYGIGGKNEFLPDCDKILSIITTDYAKTHKNVNTKLTRQDLVKIAHAINPHETLD